MILAGLMSPALAHDPPESRQPLNIARIEADLLIGLDSDNPGLQRSCARMLGQIRSDRAVISLMAQLRSSNDDGVRIASAWALSRIGDPSGTYLVRSMAQRADKAKVRSCCAWYYNTYVRPGTFMIRNAGGADSLASPQPPNS